jgi:hypothetical protein
MEGCMLEQTCIAFFALADEVIALLRDDAARTVMEENAHDVVEHARGASSIILQHCAELIARVAA